MENIDYIGHYKIIREIGSGGMGVVYLVEDRTTGLPFALKALHPDSSKHKNSNEVFEAEKRFIQEAQKTAKLADPRIVDIHDYGKDEATGILYIVMTYLDGDSLEKKIKEKGKLTYNEAQPMFLRIARALDYIHAKGIIHRDIKPSNIIFRSDEAVLADFGIAHQDKDIFNTKTRDLEGTFAYCPPEVFYNQKPDHRTDIYAFGLVIYETLTGKNPLSAAIFKKVIESTPINIPETLAPAPVREWVEKALSSDPNLRPQNCAELIEVLEKYPRWDGPGDDGEGGNPVPDESGWGISKALIWACAVLIVVVLAIIAVNKTGVVSLGGFGADGPSWSVSQHGSVMEIGYRQGRTWPQIASLELGTGNMMLNSGGNSAFGTSIYLMPSIWKNGVYFQSAPVTVQKSIVGDELIMSIKGEVSGIQSSGLIRVSPPGEEGTRVHVSFTSTGDVALDNRPGEAFKPVVLSSNHISPSSWLAQSAFIDGQSISIPENGWIVTPPLSGKTFGLVGGNSNSGSNLPTVEIILMDPLAITGWAEKSTAPSDYNISFWPSSDHVLKSWEYMIIAKSEYLESRHGTG